MIKTLFGVAGAVVLIFYFQNCSNVNISTPPVVVASKAPLGKIGANICPSLSANGKNYRFKLKQAYVLNLTSLPVRDALAIDSDMDGISDLDETLNGFDPVNRRSFGMLDIVCLKTGGAGGCTPAPGCADTALTPGITGCDLAYFKAANGSGRMTGLDTDNDFVPDLFELLRSSNIIRPDATDDYDVDLQPNLDEISIGADLNSSLSMDGKNLVGFDLEELPEPCNTRQSVTSLLLNTIRLFPDTLAVVDARPVTVGSQSIDLSHAEGENVLAIVYISEPDSTTVVNKEMYMQILKVHPTESSGDMIIENTDFVFLGEVEP